MSKPERSGQQADYLTGAEFDALLDDLRRMSPRLEAAGAWPGEQFERLAGSRVLGWVIPTRYGGCDLSATDLTFGYERLAEACLATTFVLTQRNGACQRIAGADNDDLRDDLLPKLCAGDCFATVGISHLTMSRQHLGRPAVTVVPTDNGFIFDGTVPWVTGARYADYIVTGGTCDDGRQVLAAIGTESPGVVVQDPPHLLALNSSQTGAVRLERVAVAERYRIAGPESDVMKRGQGGGAGSLTTTALAVGAAAASLARLNAEAGQRPDLVEIYEPLEAEREAISADMNRVTTGDTTGGAVVPTVESVRQRANSLVLRSAQAYLAASKGAGFVVGHPAERAVREAMFFLVWSCPQPVLTAALREFACVVEG